jgi:flagellar biosynthesis protein FlhF
MQLRTFAGPDLASVSFAARRALGDDAMIAHSRVVRSDGAARIEVAATTAAEVERFRALLMPAKPRLRPAGQRLRGPGARALVVALVGPTGAGKTTTLAKLAVNPEAFGRRRVGLLTLDTYRAGAVEQLEAYAAAAGLRCESIYDPGEVDDAMRRLADCDVILVDTPGRRPQAAAPRRGAPVHPRLVAPRPGRVGARLVPPARRDARARDQARRGPRRRHDRHARLRR